MNHFAKSDFGVFRALFHYDFSPIEADLGIDCFTTLCHYTAIYKHERRYNKAVSEKVRALSHALGGGPGRRDLLPPGHRPLPPVRRGDDRPEQGLPGKVRAGRGLLLPIYNTDKVMLADLVGYESQKQQLRENTEAFLAGRTANNALLYGDAGTGKSSSVKALINEYYDQGLRMIEIYKHQFQDLSAVIALVKNRNYRFIVFIDDLSFEENEVEYKFLKAVIEGAWRPSRTTSSSMPPPTAATSSGRPGTWTENADTLRRSLPGSGEINYSIPNRPSSRRSSPHPGQGRGGPARGNSPPGGHPVGDAPRRRLRPHGPAVHQLPGRHPDGGAGVKAWRSYQASTPSSGLSGDACGEAVCLLLPDHRQVLLSDRQRRGWL